MNLVDGYTAYTAPTDIGAMAHQSGQLGNVGSSVSLSVSLSYSVSWSWSVSWT